MPAKIYFDGLNLGLKRGTGVATYTRVLAGLSQGLGHRTGVLYASPRRLPKNPLDREVAFFDHGTDKAELPLSSTLRALGFVSQMASAGFGIKPQMVPRGGVVVTEPHMSPWRDSDDVFASPNVFDLSRSYFTVSGQLLPVGFETPPDVFHWTYPLPMRAKGAANIYTIHDLVPLRLPYTTRDWKRYYIRSMRAILKHADRIVTVSENSKRDIVTLFGVDESRIVNTYQAVNIPPDLVARTKDAVAEELAGIFGLDYGRYLLFYGSFEPKKNLGRIVQAYLAAQVKLPLVVVMAQEWQSEAETRLLNQVLEEDKAYCSVPEARRIRRYEYLPSRLLMTLLQGARALVFPSLYEGFGLPVLEAMTLGTAVITSNTAAVPEIAGDACLTVNPYQVDELREAIRAVCHDDDLRADLASKGLVRAKIFAPEAYRARIATLYAPYL